MIETLRKCCWCFPYPKCIEISTRVRKHMPVYTFQMCCKNIGVSGWECFLYLVLSSITSQPRVTLRVQVSELSN